MENKITARCSACKRELYLADKVYQRRIKASKYGELACSRRCIARLSHARALKRMRTIICGVCNRSFQLRQGDYTRRTKQSKSGMLFCGSNCTRKFKTTRVTKACRQCSAPFNREKYAAKHTNFCSKKCSLESRRPVMKERSCAECGIRFKKVLRHGRPNKFCNVICFRKNLGKTKIRVKCYACRSTTLRRKFELKKRMFCSFTCRSKWLKKEQKRKYSKKCQNCGITYVVKSKGVFKKQKYCSFRCFLKAKRPTRPEIEVKRALKSKGIYAAVSQNPLRGFTFPDFVLPHKKICIYVDGTYWHSSPTRKIKDKLQNKVLRAAGYQVVRIPEADAMNPKRLEAILKRTF